MEFKKIKKELIKSICNDCSMGNGYCGEDCREIMLIRKYNKVVDRNKYNYFKKSIDKKEKI